MPDGFPEPIPQAELNRLFPMLRPPMAQNTYEFGLTLGGTVSAGTYTAGVLDYFLEALDAWTRAKEDNDPDAPMHNAILSTIAGASGGAINGAILTRLTGWEFPHGPVAANPFYDLWVNGVDLAKLLSPDEPGVSGFAAIFNTSSFSVLADGIIKTVGAPLGTSPDSPRRRRYLADPMRLFMMVANVTGIPYSIQFRGQSGLSHDLFAHADFVRFGLTVPGGVGDAIGVRPDETALVCMSDANWDMLAASALATCAFPAAFRSRPLSRAWETLGYRVATVPGETPGTIEVAQLIPRWEKMQPGCATPGHFRTVNVDGGTHNNEPLEFTRVALSGLNGRNRRKGNEADRGVILIDPFSDPETLSLFDPPNFLDLLGPLVNALVQQSRFKPEDIALATDYDTYSRFLIAPSGPGHDGIDKSGSKVIASGGLGGFLGFVDKRFLDYDFRLGRRNAYEFLLDQFVLPGDNPIFQGKWSTAQLNTYQHAEKNPQTGKTEIFLPIIPLMRKLRDDPPKKMTAADWPRLPGNPPQLRPQVRGRLDAIYKSLKQEQWWPGTSGSLAADAAWKLFLRDKLEDAFAGKIETALKDQNLV